ncbi:MAG: cyclohexanecarboxylate-CoA ligase [Burkholderiales bacterium]|nr:MAG: cyclohexanecarboxylate-CoA ligase [Burkholderiales bacterium]
MEELLVDARRIAKERERGIWPDRVLTDYLDRWIEEKGNATALIGYREETGATVRLSWRELGERVARIAQGLSARGVGKGDVVSLQLPNWWEFVAVHLACLRIGAITNPLMPIFRHRELSFMVGHAESKVFIAPSHFRGFDHGALARSLSYELPSLQHVFLVDGDGADSFEHGLLGGPLDPAFMRGTAVDANGLVQLLYTSGTTGEPKGVLHTSNTLLGTILQFVQRLECSDRDIVFMPSPLAHQAGFAYGLMLGVALGAPIVLLDIWHPRRAVELMEQYRVTYTFASTPFLADLAQLDDVETRDLRAFRLFVTSGAPIPPVVVKQAQENLGVTVVASWGMSEVCSATTTLLSGHKVRESDGIAVPGSEVKVVDDNGNELPRGQQGSLRVRSAALFVGYLKRPQLYTVDEDGWFNTGDIARMDDEGYIRICGRDKDIVIRGGENIPVVEIEAALYRMPGILEAAIVGMPDPRLGERACAFVAVHPGAQVDLASMRAFLDEQGISKNFWPERLEILDQLPRNPTGKVLKFVLRQMAHKLAESLSEPSAKRPPRAS